MKKSKLMRRIERERQQAIERLLPDMVNAIGQSATAEELGISKATLGYWLLKLGYQRVSRVEKVFDVTVREASTGQAG